MKRWEILYIYTKIVEFFSTRTRADVHFCVICESPQNPALLFSTAEVSLPRRIISPVSSFHVGTLNIVPPLGSPHPTFECRPTHTTACVLPAGLVFTAGFDILGAAALRGHSPVPADSPTCGWPSPPARRPLPAAATTTMTSTEARWRPRCGSWRGSPRTRACCGSVGMGPALWARPWWVSSAPRSSRRRPTPRRSSPSPSPSFWTAPGAPSRLWSLRPPGPATGRWPASGFRPPSVTRPSSCPSSRPCGGTWAPSSPPPCPWSRTWPRSRPSTGASPASG